MKAKWILRVGALSIAMATVFMVASQKNNLLAETIAYTDGNDGEGEGAVEGWITVCKCATWFQHTMTNKTGCKVDCGGSECAKFNGNGDCSQGNTNCSY